MNGSKTHKLEALKARLAAFETRPSQDAEQLQDSTGWLSTPRGYVHEVFADSPANSGAAFGFALAQARTMLTPARPGLLLLQLKADTQELGLPYGLGFASAGLHATAFVLIRTDTVTELLWAAEEALACRAVGAIIADIAAPPKALDFTASRRLTLRTAGAGGSLFLIRYARDREATAARYRWRVEPHLSAASPFDDRAPGQSRWRVTLEKGSLSPRRSASDGEHYLVDLTEHGLVRADIDSRKRTGTAGGSALSVAASAAVGNRVPKAG